MTPHARISGLEIHEQDGGLRIRDTAANREHVLHPLTAFVWKHADGQTSVAELAALARESLDFDVTEDHVWAAIDVLTGAQLMEGRVAPPAGTQRVNRRDLLRSVAVGSAAAAALGVIAVPHAQAATAEQAKKASAQEQEVKAAAAKESAKKVAQEDAQKRAQESEAKRAAQQEQAQKAKAQEQEAKQQAQAAQEQSRKAQHQEEAAKHDAASEQRNKARDPFAEVVLDPFNWGNIGEGYAPAVFERRGAHVSLFGLVEFIGETEVPPPDADTPPPDPEVPTTAALDGVPTDPIDVDDEDDLEIETMLIGTLPEGARPEGRLVFSVPSDALTGNSEVHITADGEILLVLEDESDDELDEAAFGAADPPGELPAEKLKKGKCLLLRKALRRKRMKARLTELRRRRRLLRRRARLLRRHRCTDGKEVMMRGPSEVSLSGITFRVKA